MQNDIPPEIASMVKREMSSGKFASEEEVLIAAGVEALKKERERQYKWLDEVLARAEEEHARGELVTPEELKASLENILNRIDGGIQTP